MYIQPCSSNWSFRQVGNDEWLKAHVPGGVHTDLMEAGRLVDPFVRDYEKHVRWVAESDWQYHTLFACAPELLEEEQVWLVCDGLDTLAAVTLNDQELGRTNNMFRQYRWQVKHLLKATDQNELVVTFHSPVRYITEKQNLSPLPGVPQAIPGGPYLRKAPCQFGWDWGPQLPPIGIWKEVRLEGYSGVRIEDVHLRQEHAENFVKIKANVWVESLEPTPLSASLRITSPDGEVIEGDGLISNVGEAALEVFITNPLLWWPNGYGDQPLYTAEITIHRVDDDRSWILDQRSYQIGLRTIELRQEEDEWGRSFVFVVNGVPIWVKGSNWIPADSFPTRITSKQLERLISAAVETHQNMLRVWGGGFYEDERFYDLCDRYGILVWQEFIFSCSIYPLDDPDFLENVHAEAIQNIRRLRHRASLALWCGNNEMEEGWVSWNWNIPELQDLRAAYDQFFHHTLPEWCTTEDPDHDYWPSSPSSNTPFENPNGQIQGDAHYWEVWHGRKPFTAYRDQYPRFMSEFGFQALPPLETIRSYADEADWNMTSYIMEQHQKNASGNSLMVGQMLDTFRLPKDFDSLVYLSMALQAEGIRYGVEHWRRHLKRVAGTLYWQLNDCWPVASWSSLDYFGRWKALHYAARRFYAPILLSIQDESPKQAEIPYYLGEGSSTINPTQVDVPFSIYVTNDLLTPWEGEVHWSLETLGGQVIESGLVFAKVEAQSAALACSLDFSGYVSEQTERDLIFIAELWQFDQRIALQVATFVPIKHLSLTDPAVTAALQVEGGQLTVKLSSASLALLLDCSLSGADAIFSDNYLALPAGRTVTITCTLPSGWTVENARQNIRLRSVYDSYAHPL